MRLVGAHWQLQQPPTLRNDVCHGGFTYATASGCKKFIDAVISMQPGTPGSPAPIINAPLLQPSAVPAVMRRATHTRADYLLAT